MTEHLPINRTILYSIGAGLALTMLIVNLFNLSGWIAGGLMFALVAWRANKLRATLHDTYVEVVPLVGAPRTTSYANIARVERAKKNGMILHLKDGGKPIGIGLLADADAAAQRLDRWMRNTQGSTSSST